MICRVSLLFFLIAYIFLAVPHANHLKNRPASIKLGHVPDANILKLVIGEHRCLLAQILVAKVQFYYGTILGIKDQKVIGSKPEYFRMFRMMQSAVKLDPYNMDAYYLTQAAFTWEIRKIREVNDMLEHGMKFRTWDPQLPFFRGFNASYFQQDYRIAAHYLQKAAQISGDPLFTNLAARYFYQSNQTQFGLLFLEGMKQTVTDEKIRRLYEFRIDALKGVLILEKARDKYVEKFRHFPLEINDLVASGIVKHIPSDPYGGRYYIGSDGTVHTTSKFSFR